MKGGMNKEKVEGPETWRRITFVQPEIVGGQTRKKIIFVREPNFDLKMSGQSIWKNFQN